MARKKAVRSDSKIKFAVVGLGHIAQAAFIPAFKKNRLPARLHALVSGDEKKLKKVSREYGVEILCDYSQYEELLDSGQIDAVYIALPNTMHYKYSLLALEKGVHVLCEKPLCPGEDECRKLIRAAEKNKVKLMTAYRLHFDPINLKAIELINKNKIGEPIIFNSLFSYQIKDDNIRLDKKLAGGAIYDIGIYCINAARYLFRSEPEAVFGRLIKGQDKRFKEVDGTVAATLFFPKGKIAQFTASFAAFEKSAYEIIGEKGSIQAEPAYKYAQGLALKLKTSKATKVFKQKKHDQFAAQIEYFCRCISKNLKPEPDGEEGLADIRIINAIEESNKSGKLIELASFKTDYPKADQAITYQGERKEELVHAESASS